MNPITAAIALAAIAAAITALCLWRTVPPESGWDWNEPTRELERQRAEATARVKAYRGWAA